jgi:2-methylcitrate dehydratase PrpD
MASGLVAHRVGLRELTDAFVQRPDIQGLMKKVEIITTSDYDAEQPGAAQHDQVTLRLADGRALEGEPVARALGSPSRPLTDQQLYDKFADCLTGGDSPIPAEVLFQRLSAIQSINACDLTARA